ncbi:hypothetical protein P7349_15435, partial [Staphylococcus aureus]|nr:hypothetical protein [Staphylococcus aureus]
TYASIIFTAILGFVLFGESPDFYATLGYVVIIGASYYMFEKAMDRFANEIQQYGFEVKLGKVQPPHYVDKNDPFVQKLVT